MNSSRSYFVKTEGVRLPDGTVWGAGTEEKLRVVCEEMRPNYFRVYSVVGKSLLEIHQGTYLSWGEMMDEVIDFVNYQRSIGNRVSDRIGEIKAISRKETVYC